jgi:hypothetical protein
MLCSMSVSRPSISPSRLSTPRSRCCITIRPNITSCWRRSRPTGATRVKVRESRLPCSTLRMYRPASTAVCRTPECLRWKAAVTIGLLEPGWLARIRAKLPYSRLDTAALSRCAVTPLLPSRSAMAIDGSEYWANIGTRMSNNLRRNDGGVRREVHSICEMTHPMRVVSYTSSSRLPTSQEWIVSWWEKIWNTRSSATAMVCPDRPTR